MMSAAKRSSSIDDGRLINQIDDIRAEGNRSLSSSKQLCSTKSMLTNTDDEEEGKKKMSIVIERESTDMEQNENKIVDIGNNSEKGETSTKITKAPGAHYRQSTLFRFWFDGVSLSIHVPNSNGITCSP